MKNFFHPKNKRILWLFICFFIFLATPSISYAHKVNIFAYVEGDLVYTESYFPDGRKVEKGTIEVYDSQKNKLLSGTTDKKGVFNFRPPKKDDLTIVIIAGMGHKNSYLLSSEELPDTISSEEPYQQSLSEKSPLKESPHRNQKAQSPALIEPGLKAAIPSQQVDLQKIKEIIDQSLEQKLRPVIRELTKSHQEEKISFTEVFGGIGYIFGIIGIILYFNKKNPS